MGVTNGVMSLSDANVFNATGAPFDPSQIASLIGWWKADAITGLSDGQAVASWVDSSGTGKTATQATPALQPTYKVGILNGKPVVRFNHTNQTGLATPSFTHPGLYSLFAVANLTSVAANQNVIDADIVGPRQWQFKIVDGTPPAFDLISFVNGSTAFTATENVSYGSWLLLEGINDAPGNQVWVRGVAGTPASAAGTPNTSAMAMTIGFTAFGPGGWVQGDIAEVIYYSTALSAADRARVENYLIGKYAI